MYKHNHIQKRIVHSYIRTIFKFIAYTTLSLLPQSRLRNPLVPFAALKGVTCYAQRVLCTRADTFPCVKMTYLKEKIWWQRGESNPSKIVLTNNTIT